MSAAAASNPKPKLQGMILVAILGWLNALYTLWHRQTLLSEGLEKPSFCNVSSTVNCDTVALSDYSAFLGIPTSAWGMFFYSIVLLLAIWTYFAAQDKNDEKVAAGSKLLGLLTIVGLVPTLALAGVSVFVLKSLCLMCALTYVLNLILAVIGFRLMGQGRDATVGASLGKMPQALWIALVVSAALHILAAPRMVLNSGSQLDDRLISSIVASHLNEPVRTLRVDNVPTLGPADAPVTIVEFSDMQCPFCARAAATLPNFVQSYGGKVRLVFKHYPLDPTCNSGIKGGGHGKACQAAKAAHCVFKAKGNEAFFRFTDELFQKQTQIGDSLIEEAAAREGLDKAALAACVGDFATQEAILADITEANAAGVQATPTLYINGKKSEYGTIPKVLKQLVDAHLNQKK